MPLEGELSVPYGADYYPFAILVAMAVIAALWRRNRLALACWSVIIPMAFTHFLFAGQGWAQFGYRFALDYYPFLFLLTIQGMGSELRWHHKALIALSVAVNLWGVLAINKLQPLHALGLDWATF